MPILAASDWHGNSPGSICLLGIYTQWYWKTDLHNLFHFLALRADPHAQYEIRVYAEAMLETVKAWVPLACDAFLECRLGGAELTGRPARRAAPHAEGRGGDVRDERARQEDMGRASGGAGRYSMTILGPRGGTGEANGTRLLECAGR